MIRLLLADDQGQFRQALASLLDLEQDLEIVGQAQDGREAISLTAKLHPDIILMDIRMPICDGVEATQEIHRRFPWIRILVLTTFDEDEYIWKSLQAGALGYLLKSTPASQLAAAVRMLHNGHFQLGPTIAPKVIAQLRPPLLKNNPERLKRLSDRELEILNLIGQGKSNREISENLHLTEGTIKNYVSQLLNHLGVRDRTQAALWAQQHLDRPN
ncbi:Transcriptional regulatory protein LiaR [Acaryochloris thomasi RCC1774]|uniref:Transcriptional regulatory protein LiaR n=1 Tax=Acaryochloris thomasi RCC1774 TaxID=1764569 RepID=A0A2W1K6B7_9CYAN|nr:response regulator transcription factor [Acaryochloris thomasi]PZD75291.1 Transcriptional regulatory protein LiaR [Acaryochloris thomasi RCC1774]